jgi:hypothetical protein
MTKNRVKELKYIFVINITMPYIIVIDKTGTIKETNIKEYNAAELYKKANFKSAEGFRLEHKWIMETNPNQQIQIAIYGKKNGKAGQENKYDFPPPIDTVLFFGGCVLVSENVLEPNKIKDLRISEWKAIYEKLMGGFEDLKDTDEEGEDEEEDDTEPNEYICDDFVVEDDDIDYDNLSSQEEEEEEVSKKKKNNNNKKKNKKSSASKKTGDLSIILETSNNDNTYLDCQSELEEEEYFA